MIVETARCVKCGLCLAECPTYGLTASEAMSPRGRITLVQALAQGQILPDDHSAEVLNSCLLCRRCEAMCPSEVQFAKIMDQGLSLVRSQQGIKSCLLHMLLPRPGLMRWLLRLGRPVLPAFPRLNILARQARTDAPRPAPVYRPDIAKPVGRVGLFVGCTGSLFDSVAVDSAISLLLRAGYEVAVPAKQVCCGALDAHAGNIGRAVRLAAANEAAFAAIGELDAVISIASGCGAQLDVYEVLGARHRDIAAFLAQEKVISRLEFRPLSKSAAVHIPCTLENVLHSGDAVMKLLACILELKAEAVGKKGACCGAGGTGAVLRPGVAERLREPFVRQIADISPDFVLSSNLSCRLHLQSAVDGQDPEYLHPVTLLARQLIRD
ncbi:(Fe-S)-binding protein [Thiolapillus sp.]|uniref:(Fe-S)-binding protein n=1 Tax=Thiolapillus sp. TaxID=2017437 RepID=UPI003AF61A95